MSRLVVRGATLLVLALATSLAEAPAQAAAVEVRLTLPQRARLDLRDKESVAIAPFLVVSQEGQETGRLRNVDVEKEFERYLTKIMKRETELKVIEGAAVELPPNELETLARDRDFWAQLGNRLQADLLVTGSLDFDVQDRSGYRSEEFVSPLDGRTYFRQVLVEQTGFEYDILMLVFDGRSGELLYRDNFKDFQSFAGEEADPLKGMFENLRSLEDRILAVFVQKEVEASRVLFTD